MSSHSELNQPFELRPLGATLGAEVIGLDLNRMSVETFSALHQAWLDANGVLVIRDQQLQPEDHLRLGRRFGPLFGEADHFQDTVQKYLHPQHPGIYRVSNKSRDGVPQGRARAGNYWHSDVSFRREPALASLLYAIELPDTGGDTQFASMHAAYDELSVGMKRMLAPLRAVHDFAAATHQYPGGEVQDDDLDGRNRTVHPVVIRHPESRRPALFVNPGFTSALVGFTAAESAALLDFLYRHATKPEFVYRHQWKAGDLMIWDNRAVMHYAIVDYVGARYLHRVTVLAAPPQAYQGPESQGPESQGPEFPSPELRRPELRRPESRSPESRSPESNPP